MKASRKGVITWEEVFEYRAKQESNRPIHAKVIVAEPSVPNVRSGDEVFIHEISTDEISLKRQAVGLTVNEYEKKERRLSTPLEWKSASENIDDLEIVLPLEYNGKFMLCPTYPIGHIFQSVQDVLDTLPAVNRVIYPMTDILLHDKIVRARERLEILDQVQDTLTGNEILSVRSMKTEGQFLLPASINVLFQQVPSDCFKSTPDGLSAREFVRAWKPGRPPFTVKLCSQVTYKDYDIINKPSAKKKDKKNKQQPISGRIKAEENITPTNSEDRSLIPPTWWDKKLLLKPFQKIRIKNIMFDSKEFFLPESAKLMIQVISADEASIAESMYSELSRKKSRGLSAAEIFSGPLNELPLEFVTEIGEPLLLMVTAGTVSTGLRQQTNILEGSRIVVYRALTSKKFVMCCSRSQKFLVDTSYQGTLKILPQGLGTPVTSVENLLNATLPCKVQITNSDSSLGYDQLAKRQTLTVLEVVTETTLIVDIISPTSQILSEKPFEMALLRTNLSVQALEPDSHKIDRPASFDLMKQLPAVEFISDSDFHRLKKCPRRYSSDAPQSPEFALRPKEYEKSWSTNNLETSISQPTCSTLPKQPYLSDSPTPPPRPPKSPSLQKESFDFVDIPQRPPKPHRYKQQPLQTYNGNNSNNVVGEQSLSSSDSIRMKKEFVEKKRNSRKSVSESKLHILIEEQRTMLSAIKPLSPMHAHVKYQETELNDQSLNDAEIGTYHEPPIVKDKGISEKKSVRSMTNPNYDMTLTAVVNNHNKTASDTTKTSESIYVFAKDILPLREQIPSLTDDMEDYEVMCSPTETNDYMKPWEMQHSLVAKHRVLLSEDDSDYEIEYENSTNS
uniref:uncharacterized protein LOC120337672 isoform X1 n=1 Tax=Styela clava TaxID=7725 RepID=UPI001939C9E0|nr:uncharacterized protein LOC120337672 isoform X1 [Styela clava]